MQRDNVMNTEETVISNVYTYLEELISKADRLLVTAELMGFGNASYTIEDPIANYDCAKGSFDVTAVNDHETLCRINVFTSRLQIIEEAITHTYLSFVGVHGNIFWIIEKTY